MARSLVAGVYADSLKKFSSSSRRVNQKAFGRATSLTDVQRCVNIFSNALSLILSKTDRDFDQRFGICGLSVKKKNT
jgi:hypothetical protein